MAEPRSRKTSEHDAQLIRLISDAAAMRAQLAALEKRVQKLEAELAATRAAGAGMQPPAGPPPLPKMPPVPRAVPGAATPARGSRRSVVDISEIAELVDSIPPPAPTRPRK